MCPQVPTSGPERKPHAKNAPRAKERGHGTTVSGQGHASGVNMMRVPEVLGLTHLFVYREEPDMPCKPGHGDGGSHGQTSKVRQLARRSWLAGRDRSIVADGEAHQRNRADAEEGERGEHSEVA